MRLIYLDHAATSWPKPPAVAAAVARALAECGNPGRSGHPLALAAARCVLAAREAVARLLGVRRPERIAFGRNATEAINAALQGILRPGDRVVVTGVEHNAVMRPLRAWEGRGVTLLPVPHEPCGTPDLESLARLLKGARLLVSTHASNVLGTLMPLAEMGHLARSEGVLFLVDGAQTAGAVPIDLADLPVDLFAFTGHKALLGPQGTGGLYIREGLELAPWLYGGTGSASELEQMPEFAPDRYEAGTPNVPGLAGLAAAIQHLEGITVAQVRARELELTERFLAGAREIPGLIVYGPLEAARRCGLVALNLAGVSPSALGTALEAGFGILTRVGLHCAPAAHRTAGTWPAGSVRLSWGMSTTTAEMDVALEALATLARALS